MQWKQINPKTQCLNTMYICCSCKILCSSDNFPKVTTECSRLCPSCVTIISNKAFRLPQQSHGVPQLAATLWQLISITRKSRQQKKSQFISKRQKKKGIQLTEITVPISIVKMMWYRYYYVFLELGKPRLTEISNFSTASRW